MDAIDRTAPDDANGPLAKELADDSSEITACCVKTIHQHAVHNPMMVCSDCKQIIKCFKEERAFANYLTFCRSRRRPVLKGIIEGLYTVVFRSYDTGGR